MQVVLFPPCQYKVYFSLFPSSSLHFISCLSNWISYEDASIEGFCRKYSISWFCSPILEERQTNLIHNTNPLIILNIIYIFRNFFGTNQSINFIIIIAVVW